MNNKKLILIAASALGVVWLLSRNKSAAATANSARKSIILDPVSEMLGATWIVPGWSVQKVSFTPGNAIGNYTGLSQADALATAVSDYNDKFISPWTTGYGVLR